MKLYAVFGNPISHSLSPFLHNFTFQQLGIDARYTRILLQNGADLRRAIREHNLSGANITLPFKESAFLACDEVQGIAQKIGAVNTIVCEGGKLIGYNTDAEGFYESLLDSAKFNIKNALIIGAGGSARAIAFALQAQNIQTKIINRSSQNLAFFAESSFDCALISDFCANFKAQNFDCVINATSSSINGELPLDSAILSEIFGGAKIAVDLMYGKKCPFLEFAKKRRICALDGSKMLLYQAIKASYLFLNANSPRTQNRIKSAMLSAHKILQG